MKAFLKDWRNSALAGASLVILILIGVIAGTGRAPVVRVASETITQQDIIRHLKHTAGSQIVSDMLSDRLLESYALQKGITATTEELDQFVDFQRASMSLQGRDLDRELQNAGITLDEFRDQYRRPVLEVKLVVPEKELQAEVAKQAKNANSPFAVPARFLYQEFFFDSEKNAKDVLGELRADAQAGMQVAQSTALNGGDVNTVKVFVPQYAANAPDLAKTLAALKPGKFSEPFAVTGPQESGKVFCVLKLVKVVPPELPTMKNRSMIVGQYLLKTNNAYAEKAMALETDALKNVDVQFYPAAAEYQQAFARFQKAKEENPQIPLDHPGAIIGGPDEQSSATVTPPASGK